MSAIIRYYYSNMRNVFSSYTRGIEVCPGFSYVSVVLLTTGQAI